MKKKSTSSHLETAPTLKAEDEAPEENSPRVPLPSEEMREVVAALIQKNIFPTENENTSWEEISPAYYEIQEKYAEGGLGQIYRVKDKRLQREVALKELKNPSRAAQERFLREALITAQLQHPSIVPVHEAGIWPTGEPFYAMKLIEGVPLSIKIQESQTLTERLALLPHIVNVSEAIAYAHSKHIIHRDLKPQNIIVGEFGETIVIDWGLAKDIRIPKKERKREGPYRNTLKTNLTQTGTVLGTPAYMPPEQAKGEEVDQRADVYALGTILYEVLGAQKPYLGDTSEEILLQVQEGPPVPLQKIVPKIPGELTSIIQKAMSRPKEARYKSAKELAQELKQFQTGQVIASHTYSLGEHFKRWLSRHRVTGVILFALLLLLVVTNLYLWELSKANQREVTARQSAEEEQKIAEQREIALLTEQGRQELLAGRAQRAAVLLGSAYQKTEQRRWQKSERLRFSLAEVMNAIEYTSFFSHSLPFTMATYSPDSQSIITLSKDETAKIWNAKNGKLIHSLNEHTAVLHSAVYSADGQYILTASQDKTAIIWNAKNGKLIHTLIGHTDAVWNALYSPDSNQILTVSHDKTAKIWEAKTGKRLYSLEGEAKGFHTITYSPDGQYILTAGEDQPIRRWNAKNGQLVDSFGEDSYSMKEIFTAPNKTFLVSITMGKNATPLIWDIDTNKLLFRLEESSGGVTRVQIASNGESILTLSIAGVVTLWNAKNGKPFYSLKEKRNDIVNITYSPDENYFLTAGEDGTVRVWDIKNGNQVQLLQGHNQVVWDIQYSPDGKQFLTYSPDQTIKTWNAKNGKLVRTFEEEATSINQITLSQDGKSILAASRNGNATMWNTNTGKLIHTLADHQNVVWTAQYSPDGAHILTASADQTIKIWSATTAEVLHTLTTKTGSVYSAQYSPDGTHILTAHEDGTAKIWHSKTMKPIQTLNGYKRPVWRAQYSPDGAYVLSTSQDGTAKIWNAKNGEVLHTLLGHTGAIYSAQYSSDGQSILTTSQDGTTKIWNAKNGKLIHTLLGHTSVVWSAQYSPNEKYILTTGEDGTAKIWNAKNGTLLQSIKVDDGPIYSAAYTSDGQYIFTAGKNQPIKFWKIFRETRPASEINRILQEKVPWRLQNGRLLLLNPDMKAIESPNSDNTWQKKH